MQVELCVLNGSAILDEVTECLLFDGIQKQVLAAEKLLGFSERRSHN